ncbi:MAG TPA: MopE-related protein [Polyangia bacterium]|nr:MopE-related protein [Polyangia bacterium]
MKRLVVFLLCATAGCTIRGVELSDDGGAGTGGRGGTGGAGATGGAGGAGGTGGTGGRGDAGSTDAGADACVPQPESCNGRDDDCDGVIDNGFNLNTDRNNCGMCNHQCLYPNAIGECVGGQCRLGACNFGYGDADHDPSNGCECLQTNGGFEICDGIDNDCNGIVDDGFDLMRDANNCGMCGRRCEFQNAIGACSNGTCRLDRCEPNFYDLDGNPANGCEYGCIVSNGGVEICDGLDNDCDGVIDNGGATTDAGRPCFPFGSGCTRNGSGGYTCLGSCQAGTTQCLSGFLQCIGYVGPSPEVCDNIDNDCNGVVDDPFNKQTDPLHCGGCSPCSIPHAIPDCVGGVCGIAACQTDYWNIDGQLANGCEYMCHFTGPEICDGMDNNCNGQIDEGFDKQNDPNNCGSSCLRCSYPHAAARCVAGSCVMGTCDPGWVNLNGQSSDGCEYNCTVTSMTEICNGVDDNCNGQIDEGFDLATDPMNCGTCGRRCLFAHASATCVAGGCVMGPCAAGYVDLDGSSANGCEYACTRTSATETCNGIDDNCNGQIDEGNPGGGQACNPALPGQMSRWNTGQCRAGTTACVSGNLTCSGYQGPVPETCNNLDDDCDGTIDNGFNKQQDPFNCGTCGHVCTSDFTTPTPHATAACASGVCVIAACDAGYYNRNGSYPDGCEYYCPNGSPGQPEVCDGIDNDCNGLIDAADPGLVGVANFCQQKGECAGTVPTCTAGASGGTPSWKCVYPATVQTTDADHTQIIGNETLCDGRDNDCDGCIDESYPQVGLQPDPVGGTCSPTAPQSCADSGRGACQGHGHYVCNSAQNGVTCLITSPGAAPSPEVCNGLDDDCDGIVDNAAGAGRIVEPMVAITGGGVSGTVYVYAYEASRPDATATSAGTQTARACARANVLPWTNLTYPQAVAACGAAGKRLCSETEWQRACQTSAGTACTWSFASSCTTSSTATCNTQEYDTDPMTPGNQDSLLATGSLASCYANWGTGAHIFDLTGNAKEWAQARSAGVNPLRGGSYNNILDGSTCSFNFTVADDSFQFPNVGFRCCSSSPP